MTMSDPTTLELYAAGVYLVVTLVALYFGLPRLAGSVEDPGLRWLVELVAVVAAALVVVPGQAWLREAIAKRTIDAHGGWIEAGSARGGGLTFDIELPPGGDR